MDQKMIKKYFAAALLGALIFFLGFISDKLVVDKLSDKKYVKKCLVERENSYIKPNDFSFINPLLDCGDVGNVSHQNINIIKTKVVQFIDEQKANGNITRMSVYFRDLNNGPWFGINEEEEFNPGSLLKVPKMIAVLKEADDDHLILEKNILVKGATSTFVQYFKPEVSLIFDQAYTIDELVRRMIIYSDNDAAAVLGQLLGSNILYKSYEDLGISVPTDGGYLTSVRNYGSFFRILFNASYLSNKYSEKSLRLLSEVTFDKALRVGVPQHVQVAHKFGERTDGGKKQLHDCGIIYVPDKPYLLCVMTRGYSFDTLASIIAQVSRIVYEGVEEKKVE
ncbi:MAG: hypothetical protein A2563_04600 [Candidatus Magasanikbacteria bacterium RIFOXYD1_FULL_40_23]|uniref:Beta-lactamase class A catalytic domain-containing protein n=1 Tax=Candidatus Magasanikbacteria bacterium RIFOXYD1_FULL_40_23 TaxID=1798705 RepID=A0A1F6PA36_9BACT|nr:MAG: hypothetical protein A2563_04600 [Candidatus Magasanikbacteria bacterium RIFOXYD1_FULL_40_23]